MIVQNAESFCNGNLFRKLFRFEFQYAVERYLWWDNFLNTQEHLSE